MEINYDKKEIICDCGENHDMDGLPISSCPCCEKNSFLCNTTGGWREIPDIIYRYIDSYQAAMLRMPLPSFPTF